MKLIKKGIAVMLMLMVSVPCLYATHGNLEQQPGTSEDFTAVYDTMSKYALDDSSISKTSGGILNKIQKAIIGACLKDPTVMPKSICDFNKDEIGDIEDGLSDLKTSVSSTDFAGNYWLEEGFKKNSIKYDVSSESTKRLTKCLVLNEIKKIEKLLKDYNFAFNYGRDLEDSKKFMDNILNEFKKIESIEDCDDLLTDYTGDDSEKFNTFLRKRNFRNVSPRDYAEMCKKIKVMRDGLLKNSEAENETETKVTLYRRTKLDGIVGMLSGGGVIPRDWLRQQKNQFEEKCKREDENEIGKETEQKKKDKRTEEYNKMLAGKILALLNKGPVISDRAFLSTSRSETATEGFGKNKLIINCKTGMIRGMNVIDLSTFSSEKEVLFVPDQKFKVTEVKNISKGFLSSPRFEITIEAI